MRKESIETQNIENYLLGRFTRHEQKEFEVRMLLDPSLQEKTGAQALVYKLVRKFWRRQTREGLELMYQKLMQGGSFSTQIQKIID